MDITKALAPKSDQLDAADLMGSPPQVFTIADVRENTSSTADQQPVNITLAEFPRVWRPSKGMLRVLADNWDKDVSAWVGRRVELYGEPEVYFGKEKRGGTRIRRLSHISKRNTTLVNPRGGRGAYWSVDPLPEPAAPTPEPTPEAPPASEPLMSDGQRKILHKLVNQLGLTREQKIAGCVAVIQRPIESTSEMTQTEARRVIERLEIKVAESAVAGEQS